MDNRQFNIQTLIRQRTTIITIKNTQVMFGNSFCFLFSNFFFGNIKKKKFSCIFEIKNLCGQLKFKKKKFFEEKNKKD